MGSHVTRVGAIRLGFEYQDLIALEILIDWLGHSDRYQWIKVEADEAGFLDDVIALRFDNSIIARQVKYSTDPDNEDDNFTWQKLVERKKRRGTSLLEKWSMSLTNLQKSFPIHEASMVTNRIASPEILATLDRSTELINFNLISDDQMKKEVTDQLHGQTQSEAFFQVFRFHFNYSSLQDLETSLKREFIDRLKGTESGWNNLCRELRRWVSHRNVPNPDHRIYLSDIRAAAHWYTLSELPQDFVLPDDYVLPSNKFHHEVYTDLLDEHTTCRVITASPGIGKSSYCSYLYQELRDNQIPVIRHHYYLSSSDDYSSQHLYFERAAESLLHDLFRDYQESLGDDAVQNLHPSNLRKLLKISGQYFAKQNQKLVIIIDGLDHVWRDRNSVAELQRLLEELLPPLQGITLLFGLQPVEDSLLPSIFLRHAPRETWLRLEPLDAEAVDKWLGLHTELFSRDDKEIPSHLFTEISNAFFQKSGGHPLYLHYVLKSLSLTNLPIRATDIYSIPESSHEDINQYYAELWNRLSTTNKAILHVLADHTFMWPKEGIIECLRKQGVSRPESINAFDGVQFLLKSDELGWQAYHSSLLVFVGKLSDHAIYSAENTKFVSEWLSSSAPEYLRWEYEWLLKARIGETGPLIDGTTRAWTVEAFVKRRSRRAIQMILTASFEHAVNESKLSRAFEIGLLYEHTFLHNNLDFDNKTYPILLFPQLSLDDNPELVLKMQNELYELNNRELAVLVEASSQNRENVVKKCIQLIFARLRRLPGLSPYEWRDTVFPVLNIAAISQSTPARRMVDFALANRHAENTWEMLFTYSRDLWIFRNTNIIRDALQYCIDPQLELTQNERDIFLSCAALHSIESKVDLVSNLTTSEVTSSVLALYFFMHNDWEERNFGDFFVSMPHLLSLETYEHSQTSPPAWVLYYDTFFAFVANHCLKRSDANTKWLEDIGTQGWHRQFLTHLNKVTQRIAQEIVESKPFDLFHFYDDLRQFDRPSLYPSHDDYYYIKASNDAATRISFDLLVLTHPSISISKTQLETIFSNPYCNRFVWLNEFSQQRRDWLANDAQEWLFTTQKESLIENLSLFSERSEQYAVLATIAVVHHRLDEAKTFVHSSAENLISHGEHKDMLYFQVLKSIEVYFKATSDKNFAVGLLKKVVPVIAKVENFTDGDETGNLPRELADTLSEIAPELLPTYYQWLSAQEEFYDASHAFHVFVRTADLSNDFNQAIAKSAVDEGSIQILKERSNQGDKNAEEVVNDLVNLYGSEVLNYVEDPSQSTDSGKPKTIPPFEEYEPNQLKEFMTELHKVYFWETDPLADWIEYWSKRGREQEVYQNIKTYLAENGRVDDYLPIFELARKVHGTEEAYQWLVASHLSDAGWNEYYTRKEKTIRRWEIVKRYYPTRWFQFIQDTVLGYRYEVRYWNLTGLAFVRIIEYCIYMGQLALAKELVNTVISSSHEYLPDVKLSTPSWMQDI